MVWVFQCLEWCEGNNEMSFGRLGCLKSDRNRWNFGGEIVEIWRKISEVEGNKGEHGKIEEFLAFEFELSKSCQVEVWLTIDGAY
jgi:hypothetical protein